VIEALVSLLFVLGAGLVLLASLGLVRLPDLYTRMHASTKPATLGVSLAVAALAIHSGELGIGVRAVLVVLFFLLTAPVAAHRLARAAYQAGVPRWEGTVRDELHEARRREAASPEWP
jgi:multicomponent Na+:H+ antiporter subunit G